MLACWRRRCWRRTCGASRRSCPRRLPPASAPRPIYIFSSRCASCRSALARLAREPACPRAAAQTASRLPVAPACAARSARCWRVCQHRLAVAYWTPVATRGAKASGGVRSLCCSACPLLHAPVSAAILLRRAPRPDRSVPPTAVPSFCLLPLRSCAPRHVCPCRRPTTVCVCVCVCACVHSCAGVASEHGIEAMLHVCKRAHVQARLGGGVHPHRY